MVPRRIFEVTIKALAILGIACLAVAAAFTIGDVALRRTVGVSVPGLVDITQLMMMYAIYFGVVYAFTQRSHVAVTVLVDRLSKRQQSVLAAVWWAAGIFVLAFLTFGAFKQAQAQYSYGDISQTIGIPMIWYWLPVVAGLVLSIPASLIAIICELETETPSGSDQDSV